MPFLSYKAMADAAAYPPSPGTDRPDCAAPQHRLWRSLSAYIGRLRARRVANEIERFLFLAGFDRAPWLAVGFAVGVVFWFYLANPWQWLGLLAVCMATIMASFGLLRADGRWPFLRQAVGTMALVVAAGCAMAWGKSALVGTPAIARPVMATITGTVLERIEQPAEQRVRLVVATREPGGVRAIRVRLNLPDEADRPEIAEGATVLLRARLMPPAPPMLPGSYDFARTAWFAGIAATGRVVGEVTIVAAAQPGGGIGAVQASLSRHIRSKLGGSPGTIAAAFASGDRGAIAEADDAAMRDAGLTHLLSVSGLHVSAVAGAAYFLAIRLLALWPWLALRVRLPIIAAGAAALAAIGYTLLTGSEVPTLRSCIGTVLVLAALGLGRDPLSLRLLAAAAFFVMALWPEAVIGPSFQMSFAAVIAIVALHSSAPMRAFLAPRGEGVAVRALRNLAMLLVTGIVVELALMPIGLFHFHRAGVYGALANIVAIPLTTFVTMPLIALALLLDTAGAGSPAWWLTGKSIEALLLLAHWTARQPGAVTLMPSMGPVSIALFAAGGLWLALWRGRVRLAGLLPVTVGAMSLALLRPPDILISGDGRHIGITGEAANDLLVLRESRSDYSRSNLAEAAGMAGTVRTLETWPGARCSSDFFANDLQRGGKPWRLLLSRGRDNVEERSLAAACDKADLVISDRWLPRSCEPAVLKVDRRMLARTGGLAIDLERGSITTVGSSQGEHGWWKPVSESIRTRPKQANPSEATNPSGSVSPS